jgi:hypothetical protein
MMKIYVNLKRIFWIMLRLFRNILKHLSKEDFDIFKLECSIFNVTKGSN